MVTVYYEKYWNDFCRKQEAKSFRSLEEVADWIFNSMQRDYTGDSVAICFPTPEKAERIHSEAPWSIEFTPERGGPCLWVHKMTEGGKIIFTDGKMTTGQRHWSNEVRNWCQSCEERRKAPKFDFAE